MDDWPPFVIETSAGEVRAGHGWDDVVFELEDCATDCDGDPVALGRDAR